MRAIIKLIFIAVFVIAANAKAQDSNVYYKEGDTILDHTFNDLVNYSGKSLKISDLRGKWLILDFWTRGCGACIASFPKMDSLHRAFKDKVTVLMVGAYTNSIHKNEKLVTKDFFEKRKKTHNLSYINAFDSLLAEKLDLIFVPAIFLIDPNGVIKAKMTRINGGQLKAFMEGDLPIYRRNFSSVENDIEGMKRVAITPRTENLTDNLDSLLNDSVVVSMSYFTKFQEHKAVYFDGGLIHQSKPRIIGSTLYSKVNGLTLYEFFRLAYTGQLGWNGGQDSLYGKFSMAPVVLTERRDLFTYFRDEGGFKQGTYSYVQMVPISTSTPETRRAMLLQDLERSFNLRSRIEKRNVNVLAVVVADKNKVQRLASKGGSKQHIRSSEGIGRVFKNLSVAEMIYWSNISKGIYADHNAIGENTPVLIDKTNLSFNIDLDFNVESEDWQQVLPFLREKGFDIIPSQQIMDCIVISDSK